MPEYTLSLLFWIIPVCVMTLVFMMKRSLDRLSVLSIAINIMVLSSVGFVLDLAFADHFFVFPNPHMTLGLKVANIPVEEFLFYFFGFMFIILLYKFANHYLPHQDKVSRWVTPYLAPEKGSRIDSVHGLFHFAFVLGLLIVVATSVKRWINPQGMAIPGYFVFLSIAAYIPWIFLWRMIRSAVNLPALLFTLMTTVAISFVWEVLLALPRGYWNYKSDAMVGVFIPFCSNLPVEAVSVWLFCTLIVLSYEFTKQMLFQKVSFLRADHPKEEALLPSPQYIH